MTIMLLASVPQAGVDAATSDPAWLALGIGLGVLALLFFALEIFIPSGGMIGILCGIAAVASVFAFFKYDTAAGALALVTYLVATPFLLIYGVKIWSHSSIGRRLILGGTDAVDGRGRTEEQISDELTQHAAAERSTRDALIGRRGVALTPLRPVGVIEIDGARHDALAETGAIDERSEIEVVEVLDNQIKVRPRRDVEKSAG